MSERPTNSYLADPTLQQAQPATDRLLEQLLQAWRDYRAHEHPRHEDFFCLNQTSWMGERMLPVLRRLAEVQRERDELRASLVVAHEQHQRREATLTDRVANLITDVEELRGQREFAMRELRAKIEAYDALAMAANTRLVRMAKAEASIRAVRELHRQYRSIPDFDICAGCSIGTEIRPWPCPTIVALDGGS